MNITELCIKNLKVTLTMMASIILMGGYTLLYMPKSEDPQFQSPKSFITVVYPGTNAIDMEKRVVKPVERKLSTLQDVKKINSRIENGLMITQVEFLFGSDPDRKLDQVKTAMAELRSMLPGQALDISVDKFSTTDINILLYALSSHSPENIKFHKLRKISDLIERRVSTVEGVQSVSINSLPEQQISIQTDPVKLKALGLSFESLMLQVSKYAGRTPGSYVLSGERQLSITGNHLPSIEAIGQIPIKTTENGLLYLGDLTTITLKNSPLRTQARFNSEEIVLIGITQQTDANITEVTEAVKEKVAEISRDFPDGIYLKLIHEQADSVNERLMDFLINLIFGFVLVGIISWWFLGSGVSGIIMLTIPMSILLALIGSHLAGYGLQQMSIVGFIIALGMLVDNSIVVSENILRKYRSNQKPVISAIQGSKEVGWSILGGTLTTVLAFVPLLFLNTESGNFLRSMPVSVILSLLASLLLAMTMTPLLISKYLIRFPEYTNKPRWLLEKINFFTQHHYKKFLNKSLDRKSPVLTISFMLLVLSGALASQLDFSMFPSSEKNMLLIDIEVADGAGLDSTRDTVVHAEKLVLANSAIDSVTSSIGKDFPRVYYNVFPLRQKSNHAQLLVKVKKEYQSQLFTLSDTLEQTLSQISGARIKIREFIQGPPYDAPIAIRVMGSGIESIMQRSSQIEQLMSKIDGIVNIRNPLSSPQLDLFTHIDRDKAARSGVSVESIVELIDASLLGVKVGEFYDEDGDVYPIVLNSRKSDLPSLLDLESLMIQSAHGDYIPVSQFVHWELRGSFPILFRYQREKMNLITADVQSGAVISRINAQLEHKLSQLEWGDLQYQVAGEKEQLLETFDGMGRAILIATVSILILLTFQFNSFRQPLIILSTIPFAAMGSVFILWLMGFTFSFTAFVGLTALTGIVVNNAIIFIDYSNQLIKQKYSRREAIVKSCCARLLPVLMTTVTTILGLMPLSLSGSSLWAPMACTIIGGLLVATVASMILVPVFYDMLSAGET